MLPTPSELIATLDRYVLGQERAKRDLATAVYNHYLAAAWRESHGGKSGGDFGKQHVLLLGPTGTGKTYLVTRLAEALGVPVAFCTATSLVEAGYRGQEIESIVDILVQRAGGDPRRAERGIVFLDEVDKIRRQDTGGTRDVSGEGVQNGLLTMLDGRLLRGVDSGRVLFIAAGAFAGLADIVRARFSGGRQMGFASSAASGEGAPLSDFESLGRADLGDLVRYGFIPEFVGRFAVVSPLQALGVDDLTAILCRAGASIYVQQRELFALHGIRLEFDEEALRELARRALALGTGARALNRLFLQALDPVDWRLPELASQGVTGIYFSAAALRDGGEPELIRGVRPADSRLVLDRLRRRATPEALRAEATPVRTAALGDGDARSRYETLRDGRLELSAAPSAAGEWWARFEAMNAGSPQLLLAVADELVARQATIAEFHLAYVYANTESIVAVFHYLDYIRARNEVEPPAGDGSGNGRNVDSRPERLAGDRSEPGAGKSSP